MDVDIDKMLQSLFQEFREANPSIPQKQFDEMRSAIAQQVDQEQEQSPKIVLIGESGVGKSSTINALFNAGQEVSHTEASTQQEFAVQVTLETIYGTQGVLKVYDMPGLGESLAKRAERSATYQRVLKEVDVAIWILDAQYRAIASIQRYLMEDLSDINSGLTQRMVFALNKADLVYPGPNYWSSFANLPGEEQARNIKGRVSDVEKKIREALPGWEGTVIAYSALKRYNLPQLFAIMLEAVPKKRRWVVASRKALADFYEFVDPRLLPEEKRSTQSSSSTVSRKKKT